MQSDKISEESLLTNRMYIYIDRSVTVRHSRITKKNTYRSWIFSLNNLHFMEWKLIRLVLGEGNWPPKLTTKGHRVQANLRLSDVADYFDQSNLAKLNSHRFTDN